MPSKFPPKARLTLFREIVPPTPAFSWSPFCAKLEARLRFGEVPYDVQHGTPIGGPRGKLPYVHVAEDDVAEPAKLSDTGLITDALVENGMMEDLNARLTPVERAHDEAIRAMLEDRLYFYGVREKWVDNYYTMRSRTFCKAPYPVQVIIGLIAYRTVTTALHGQGTGRFTRAEILVLKKRIWESLDALLAESRLRQKSRDEPFWVLGKEEPTEADATVFGFVTSALVCKAAPETMEIVNQLSAARDYAERIRAKYFPEFPKYE